jgi:FkbM family methyltransferase
MAGFCHAPSPLPGFACDAESASLAADRSAAARNPQTHMPKPPRKIAFVISATDHGTLIVNRFDQHIVQSGQGFGVGFQLLETAAYDAPEVDLLLKLLDLRRQHHGDGAVAVDCGANIGVHTIEWAKHMSGWGAVLAFEAQERIYYALTGNIAINNCFNARAIHAAVADRAGTMKIPKPNYLAPASFGSLELRRRQNTEFIGQAIDYSESKMIDVQTVALDSFDFPRLDLIKIDVEGMELEALAGSVKCVAKYHPILFVEMVKTDKNKLRAWLEGFDYSVFETGMNFLAIHKSDPCLAHLQMEGATPSRDQSSGHNENGEALASPSSS